MRWYDLVSMLAGAGAFAGMTAASMPIPLSGGAAVGLYLALSMLLKPREKIGDTDISAIPDGEKRKADLENAGQDLEHLEKCAPDCKSPEVRQGVRDLVRTGKGIVSYLAQNPEQVPKARRFLNYYLDTAAGLVDKYLKMQKRNAPEASMEKITRQTLEGIVYLKKAFDSQYEGLMSGEVLDMEADVETLKQIMNLDDIR